jgi:hypothetical protein
MDEKPKNSPLPADAWSALRTGSGNGGSLAGATMSGPPEHGGLTAEALARLQDAQRLSQGEPPPPGQPLWPPGAPTPPEYLEGERCPVSGRPLAEPIPLGELPWQGTKRGDRDWERFKKWGSLNAQQKTQIVCDLWYRDPAEKQWQCVLCGTPDPGMPALVIRAPDAPNAEVRYKRVCGIISISDKCSMSVTPYAPPEPQPEPKPAA